MDGGDLGHRRRCGIRQRARFNWSDRKYLAGLILSSSLQHVVSVRIDVPIFENFREVKSTMLASRATQNLFKIKS
jgi:hypothetical protein